MNPDSFRTERGVWVPLLRAAQSLLCIGSQESCSFDDSDSGAFGKRGGDEILHFQKAWASQQYWMRTVLEIRNSEVPRYICGHRK